MFTSIISTSRSNIQFKEKAKEAIGDTRPATLPWQRIDYSPEREMSIYLGLGRYFVLRQQMRLAENFFNRALEIQPRIMNALYSRSNCKRSLAQTREAFEDILKATYLDPTKPNANMELCEILYELNEFEAALAKSKEIMRNCGGPYQRNFNEFCEVIDGNLKDSLGDSAGYFFIKNAKLCFEVLQEFKRKHTLNKFPMWKILRNQNECDVESLRVKKVEMVHPLEKARRDRALRIFYQKYLWRNWIDVLTLRSFPHNEVLLAKPFRHTTPRLRSLLATQNHAIQKFAQMLHGRQPLYSELESVMKRKKMWQRCHDNHLYMIQYQTRRYMFLILDKIAHLRKIGDIKKLAQYVESSMGDYMIKKTSRVAPWKFEFMNDVYNFLGLAYADACVIPDGFDLGQRDALETLLDLPLPTDFAMNDKIEMCFKQKEKTEKSLGRFKLFLKHMERRLYFSKHSIERAYIYHAIARSQFKNAFYNDSASMAQKGYLEAKSCNSSLWAYLCIILVVRSLNANFKIDKSLIEVTKSINLASRLRSERLLQFSTIIKTLVELKISEQRANLASLVDKARRKKSSSSILNDSRRASSASESEIDNDQVSATKMSI